MKAESKLPGVKTATPMPPVKTPKGSESSLNALLSVLSGTKQKTEADRIALLELAVKVGVCGLYEHYKEDVLNTFSLSELTEIADTTHQFGSFTVEHIYKTALSR